MQSSTTLKDKKETTGALLRGLLDKLVYQGTHADPPVLSFSPNFHEVLQTKPFFFFLKMISSTAPNPSQRLELLQENSGGLRDQKFLFPNSQNENKTKPELQVAPGQTQVGDRGVKKSNLPYSGTTIYLKQGSFCTAKATAKNGIFPLLENYASAGK